MSSRASSLGSLVCRIPGLGVHFCETGQPGEGGGGGEEHTAGGEAGEPLSPGAACKGHLGTWWPGAGRALAGHCLGGVEMQAVPGGAVSLQQGGGARGRGELCDQPSGREEVREA